MNQDALGAIGELTDSIPVLASLVYLALQVRDAKNQIKTAISVSPRLICSLRRLVCTCSASNPNWT